MISIPVSFLLTVAFILLLVFVLFWKGVPKIGRFCFTFLLVLLTLETSLVGMRFALDVFDFLLLQSVLPVWIAPSAYLAFYALTCPPDKLKNSSLYHGAIALIASALILAPVPLPGLIDIVITIIYLAYTLLLTILWRRGPDIFSQIPTPLAHRFRQVLFATLLVMGTTLVMDIVISILFSIRNVQAATTLISYGSLGILLGIVSLLIWLWMKDKSHIKSKPSTTEMARLAKTLKTARQLLIDQELYKDPELTLKRLARRTGVPDRDLSKAVNQITGISFSQFVNQIRLEKAAYLLRVTVDPVPKIQEKSGFLTRSNFYREFQKQYGMPPGAYRNQS